ncbi:MAG: Trm112 family protein, partial [Candidatus Acidiferrales bacterium]
GCRARRGFDTVAKREEPMAVSKELLEILVCPVCKTPVKMTPDQQGLKCSTCRRVYPVRDDIPVMLVDEARIDAS